MSTIKIGNKVKGIIRSYTAGKIGNIEMQYGNQPYTVLNDIEAYLNFADQDTSAKHLDNTDLVFNHDTLKEIQLNNVLLTDRILELIYKINEDRLCSCQENYISDAAGMIYFNFPTDEVYQLFIYDNEGMLEKAEGTYSQLSMQVEKPDTEYSVYYSFLGSKSFILSKPENFYVTIDLEIVGNEDDNTQDMFIHIEKCCLKINKNMRFTNNNNTIDLIARVITTNKDFITIK